MRIAVVGTGLNANSCSYDISQAFRELGHEVRHVDYKALITAGRIEQELLFYSEWADLMFIGKGTGINPDIIKRCSYNCKTWLWFMDWDENLD